MDENLTVYEKCITAKECMCIIHMWVDPTITVILVMFNTRHTNNCGCKINMLVAWLNPSVDATHNMSLRLTLRDYISTQVNIEEVGFSPLCLFLDGRGSYSGSDGRLLQLRSNDPASTHGHWELAPFTSFVALSFFVINEIWILLLTSGSGCEK